MIATYVLIIALTAFRFSDGAGVISQEFNSETTCLSAGTALTQAAYKRKADILAWGCFKK